MCQSKHTKTGSFEKKFTLAQFFNAHWPEYVKHPKKFITQEQYKAVNAIRLCRTKQLGRDIYRCNECGNNVEIYHSCKNRFCPNCSWTDTLKWADKVYHKLINVPHRHVVMTLPHALNPLINLNKKFFFDTLMSASSTTMKEYIIEKYKTLPGVISVLHSFGERKNMHVHVHMIVSWGGINLKEDKLKKIPEKKHVDYSDLKETFRLKVIRALTNHYKSKILKHDFVDDAQFYNFIDKLVEKPWIIHLEPPMYMPEQVIRYIGRYSKRACLSEYKITNIEEEKISFTYKDYKEKDADGKPAQKTETLHYNDFFPLLLQHVPIKNFRLVRYCGAYATKSKINPCHSNKTNQLDSGQIIISFDQTKICERCNGKMVYLATIASKASVQWFIYSKKELAKFAA
jgi:DNA-directed RNA polymerase subunit RPC12/RpoP